MLGEDILVLVYSHSGVLQITLYNLSCKKWLGIIINKIYVKFMYLIGYWYPRKNITGMSGNGSVSHKNSVFKIPFL